MKIGFLRLSSPVELELSTASPNTLGTELRVGFLKSWVDAGHEVTIYSGIKKADLKSTQTHSLFDTDKNLWTKKIKYEPLKYPDCDILVIEQGTDNVRYAYHNGKEEISYIRRTFECLNNYSGKVVYYQHGCLPFPFRTEDASVDTINNLRNLNKRNDLWSNKEWTIWHHFSNIDEYLKITPNYEPFLSKLNFKFTMLPYSDIEPWFSINPKPKWDSLFIGSQWDSRSTKQGFRRYEEIANLYDMRDLKSAIIGKWDDKGMSHFKHTKFLGMKGKHGDAYRFWNDAYTCIYTTSKFIKKAGLIPTRLTMCNRGGAILLMDTAVDCQRLLPDEFAVTYKKDVLNNLKIIKQLSPEERDQIRRRQLKRFPKWDEIKLEEITK